MGQVESLLVSTEILLTSEYEIESKDSIIYNLLSSTSSLFQSTYITTTIILTITTTLHNELISIYWSNRAVATLDSTANRIDSRFEEVISSIEC